jgi:hypothetical protein
LIFYISYAKDPSRKKKRVLYAKSLILKDFSNNYQIIARFVRDAFWYRSGGGAVALWCAPVKAS